MAVVGELPPFLFIIYSFYLSSSLMKKIILFVLALVWTLNANCQIKLNDFTEASIYFDGLFNEECSLDEYGNVVINMGSASSGRYKFRITDVNITMEKRKEEPGCADVCPERILIQFNCKKTACINDPVYPEADYKGEEGTIALYDLQKGEKTYEYLVELQRLMKEG